VHELAVEEPRHGLQPHVRMRANVHGRRIRERQRAETVEKTPGPNQAPPLHGKHPRHGQRTERDVAAGERLELMFGRPQRDAGLRRDICIRHIAPRPQIVRPARLHPLSREHDVRCCPGIAGGTEWNGASYDPGLNTIFIGALDWCSTVRVLQAADASVPRKEPSGSEAPRCRWRGCSILRRTGAAESRPALHGRSRRALLRIR